VTNRLEPAPQGGTPVWVMLATRVLGGRAMKVRRGQVLGLNMPPAGWLCVLMCAAGLTWLAAGWLA